MARRRRPAVLLSIGIAFLLAGCVERVLIVESSPPGAMTFVDGVARGVTPVRIPYVHDGRFRVRLEKEGFETVTDEVVTCTGLDAVPGIDFFAENVSPRRIHRATLRRYEMAPLRSESWTDAELEALLRRANEFRARTEREVAEPGTPPRSKPPPETPAPPPPPRR